MVGERSGGRLTAVTKRFIRGGPWILGGVDLDLPSGSRTVVVGDNGSGKSTLLRIAAGLTRPTSGSVARATETSFVPEDLAGRSRFTAWEYLSHMGRIRGLDRPAIAARSCYLLEHLGLLPDPYTSIDLLSKGNKQKVVIAQAFLAPVGLFVLDEPYSGLDARARRTLDHLIESERRRGAAVLMTSHTVPVGPESDQVYRIGDGHLYRMQSSAVTCELRNIELTATERSCTVEQILSSACVRNSRHDQRRKVLSLVVEAPDADAFLRDAITAGWSVTGVAPLPGSGTWG
jgi:ABC-2 type transport system ATP-binding protein